MNSDLLNERLAEAARYALLRRIAPAIRHDIAGALQPISMMAAMLEKRMLKPSPDLAALGANSATISKLSRDAANSCMSLMTWLAPKENKPVALGDEIAESISLVNTEMSFRGFNLVNETREVRAELPTSVLRGAFMAGLLAQVDDAQSPADVILKASSNDAGGVVMSIAVVPTEGESMPMGPLSYRKLEWDDVAAIALSEQVEVKRFDATLELHYQVRDAS